MKKNLRKNQPDNPVDNRQIAGWPDYNPQEIEPKWQNRWEDSELYCTPGITDKSKYYCLDFFPYPSGDGLHVGHCRNYVPTDVIARYKRLNGYNVLHPMGWDAFGEPTEQYAILHGVHPRETTDNNTANFKHQMRIIGTSYDWAREIDSSKPEFYRWTQWFFLKMYQRGLAYRDANWQWWCPSCQTTLSSHEAEGGVCWRGHSGITKQEIPAWYFRITAYADELLAGLDEIDWPESIKTMQRNWIGRSEGVEINFYTQDGVAVPVFTTRPDTIYGVTFLLLAPEHPLVPDLTTLDQKAVIESYTNKTIRQSEIDRMSEDREMTGVFTGGSIINPLNGSRVPVWIADYVLLSYGTGAVMGVPAHDQRDFEFAKEYGLDVKIVIAPDNLTDNSLDCALTGPGRMINSGPFNGLANIDGIKKITDYIEEHDYGQRTTQYRMHDWLISRQRYWGTPIPIVYCDECGEVPVPEEQLPILLPEMDDFAPDGSGQSPLARVPDFVHTSCPVCQGHAIRETDTMGGFACSSWYFQRFTSPNYQDGPFDADQESYWMPVDLYVGGAEHAVLHLLYARFWTKVLADIGLVAYREPFSKLLNQGQLMGLDGTRMSKSRGNVIVPDHIVAKYGADSLRIYVMFMAPFDQDVEWKTEGINGARRFLNRVWSLYVNAYSLSAEAERSDLEVERLLHKTIKNVTERIESFRLNTMVSELMELVNILSKRYQEDNWQTRSYHQALETLLILLAPSAPHICEELWMLTDHRGSVHQQPWPSWDETILELDVVELPVQIDGKLRDRLVIPVEATQSEIETRVFDLPNIRRYLTQRELVRIVFIPGRIFNIVTR